MHGSKQQQACMECTKKCLKIHGKRPATASATCAIPISFFKIMVGDFEQVMFIPPKLAQTFCDLVNKDSQLEDSNGRRWRVRISVVDGSPAFQQGWRDFVLDHSIEFGEVVIFKYISKSFFSVQIFATSACERLHFSETCNSDKRKRKRNKTKIPPRLLHFEENNRRSEGSKEKPGVVDEYPVEEDRVIEPIPCDLSDIEMAARNCLAKDAGGDLTVAERSAPCDNSVSLQIASPVNYSGALCDTNNEDAMKVEQAGKISFINLCDDKDMDNEDAMKVEQAGKISFINLCDDKDMDIEIRTKDNSSPFVGDSGGVQTTCLVEYGNGWKENLVTGNESNSRCPLPKCCTSTMDHLEALHNMVLESSAFVHEAIIAPSTNLLDPETTETQCYPQDTEILSAEEEKLSYQDNNLRRSKTDPTVECTESETKNQIEASWASDTCPPAGKGLLMAECQNLADDNWIIEHGLLTMHAFDLTNHEMTYSELDAEECFLTRSPIPRCSDAKCNSDERKDLFASNVIVRKFLNSEEETCCNINEDLRDKLEVTKDTPISLGHIERDDNVLPSDAVAMTRNNSVSEYSHEMLSCAAILDCMEDVKGNLMPSCEQINKDTQTEEQLGNVPSPESGMTNASRVETIGSDPLTMPGVFEFHKDHVIMENSNQTGIMPADSPEVDDKKVDSCLQEKAFGVVKIESMDSIDLPSPNYANFTFSAYVNARSCLVLPEKLPSRVVRKRLNRRVVTLRDPSMRLWPVLYHESKTFIGFISGWEEFFTSNNIQKGDLCQFELANEPEPTFQMRYFKA